MQVSALTYLFTDLKDSTPLYESVGERECLFSRRQHFDILTRSFGTICTIVKTIAMQLWLA